MLRAVLVYAFGWIVMTIYGGEVCPFLESLSMREWATTLLVAFAIAFALRTWAVGRWGVPANASAVDTYQGARQFALEFAPFVLIGVGVAAFDRLYYGFPLAESGLAAVLVGAALIGIFSAIHLSLDAERRLVRSLKAQGKSLAKNRGYFPLTRKFALFASLLILAMTTVTLMVVSHDLTDSISFSQALVAEQARMVMMLQMGFIMLVFLIIVLDLIFNYSRNLRLLFENEIEVLEAVDQGRLQGHVSVVTNDEFGIIADYTNRMIESLRSRTEQLERTQDVTIHSLASLAETRDNETGAHLIRTQRYVCVIATHLKEAWGLTEAEIDLLYKSAPLHDIGKVGIPDAILLKPGPLTDSEWVEMKRHAEYGAQALAKAEAHLGTSSFLRLAREIAESHHEKWDGSGYPRGLRGAEIPYSGRIMAIADVYDALISKRTYKDAFPHEKAREIIAGDRGTHFDPDVVDAFLAHEGEFADIARDIADGASAEQLLAAHPASRR
jgi:HD-GYP domain-containing protein (c-di-GMP phosphodiesterase class II)